MANIAENIGRAVADFDSIKAAIEDSGVDVGNVPTSEYGEKIEEIGKGQEIYYSSNGRMYTENIVFPDGLEIIGGYISCKNLKSIALPNSVTTVDTSAFNACTSLKDVVMSNNLKTLKQNAFYNCPLEKIYLPASLTTIGAAVFSTQYFRDVSLGKGFDCSLDIKAGNYTVDVMLAMFDALKDNTGLEAKTLTLGATNLAKLTTEQLQTATNKNWNLA